MSYARTPSEIQARASLWWPRELAVAEAEASIIPNLLKTQAEFISVLKLAGKSPLSIFNVLASASFPGNTFLKHLVVLTDVGGEPLQRISSEFGNLFERTEEGSYKMRFVWKEKEYEYVFSEAPQRPFNNKNLGIDGPSLLSETELTPLQKDAAVLLLFGSTSVDETVAETLAKCEVGTLLGLPSEIERYVDERYLWVSRITGGAQANNLGQIAQSHVADVLRDRLGDQFTVTRNGKIVIDRTTITFDVLIEKGTGKVGIEVSFQVTTNSTIERKANEADNRYRLMSAAGYPIAYVIDGAGNFQRASAIGKICQNSDCTVAYSEEELEVLTKFVRSKLK